MLKILDRNNKVKFVLPDEAEEPLSIDELIISENEKKNQKEKQDGEKS